MGISGKVDIFDFLDFLSLSIFIMVAVNLFLLTILLFKTLFGL